MSQILAIETSTQYCSVALLKGGRCNASRINAGQRHSELVLDMVAEVLALANTGLSACDAIAFGAGPGSFTGLRIACAVAQGLAYGQDLPVVAISTLAAMAEQCRSEHLERFARPGLVVSVLDARMDEVYWSVLEWTGEGWRERVPAALSKAGEVVIRENSLPIYGCGNGFLSGGLSLYAQVHSVLPPTHPDAQAVAVLGQLGFEAGAGVLASQAAPLYVRDRVALTTAERQRVRELNA